MAVVYAIVTEDGYLLIADEDIDMLSEFCEEFSEFGPGYTHVFEIRRVPQDLADKLVVHGTSDQWFSDGYEAWDAVREARCKVIDLGEEDCWSYYEPEEVEEEQEV